MEVNSTISRKIDNVIQEEKDFNEIESRRCNVLVLTNHYQE